MTSSLQTATFGAYNAYLALLTAAVPDAVVYDGPQVMFPSDRLFILAGADDPTTSGPYLAVDGGTQDWESLGAYTRMEAFLIWASLVCWTADERGIRACRDTAQASIQAIGAALRPPPHGTGDGMLGGALSLGGTGWCGLTVTRMQQAQFANGPGVYVSFALACTALI